MYHTIAQGQRARLIAMLGRRLTQRTTQHNTKIRNTYFLCPISLVGYRRQVVRVRRG